MGISGSGIDDARSLYEGGINLLLLAPESGGDAACMDLLTPSAPADEDALLIIFSRAPAEQLSAWRSHVGLDAPARTGIIAVGDALRSASDPVAADGIRAGSIETVAEPTDLTGIGMALSSFLSRWRDDGNRLVVCFRTLSAALEHSDADRLYRFLHAVTGRLQKNDAVAHFHMDPDAHDPSTASTMTTLFDAVVEHDGEAWSVRRR